MAKHSTISALLQHHARVNPTKVFLHYEYLPRLEAPATGNLGYTQCFTYGEFAKRVGQLCNWLHEQGINSGDVVNIHLSNCPQFVLFWFACARMGVVMLPTNVMSSEAELVYLLNHAGAKLAVTEGAWATRYQTLLTEIKTLDKLLICDITTEDDAFYQRLDGYQSDYQGPTVEAHQLAAIMYTSGTTARPKGVMVTQANYYKAGKTVADALLLQVHDRQYVVLPLFHGNAQYYSFMSALCVGASVALMSRFSASMYFDKATEYQCTVASLFAAPMRMILAQPREHPQRQHALRVMIYAQQLTKQELEQWRRSFTLPLLQLWGMTETMGPPLMNPLGGEVKNQSIGLPIGDYEVALVDEQGHHVKQGDIGELIVKGETGKTIMLGYLHDAQATQNSIRNGWLFTGDKAVQDAEGYFFFVDRAKDMIKRAGENVAASEVEAVILDYPNVYDCAVIGIPDTIRDAQIVAVIVLQDQSNSELSRAVVTDDLTDNLTVAEAIHLHCQKLMANFRVPSYVIFTTQLPRTSVGKIQKHLLREQLMSHQRSNQISQGMILAIGSQ